MLRGIKYLERAKDEITKQTKLFQHPYKGSNESLTCWTADNFPALRFLSLRKNNRQEVSATNELQRIIEKLKILDKDDRALIEGIADTMINNTGKYFRRDLKLIKNPNQTNNE